MKNDKSGQKLIRFTVRITEAERDYLFQKAVETGITAGEYMRRCLKGRPSDYLAVKQINDLLYEVRRIGNNINQIAHNANCGYYNEAESTRLLANMKVVTDLVEKAVDKIGDQ